MKKTILALFVVLSSFVYGQVPNQINYQGVARNSVGNVIPNKKITVRLSIRDGNTTGTVLYNETRTINTNSFGLFNIIIGGPGATNVTGAMSGIDWSTGAKFIQVEIDPEGGSNFINMGAAQLLSVPYALYAGSSSTGTPTGVAGGVLTGNFPNPSIAPGAITQSMIANGVIPTSLPPNGTAGGDLTGTYPNPTINNGAITTTKIADGSVTSLKLAAGVIPTSLPPNGAAGGDLNGTYPNPTIKNGAVTNAKISDNAITTSKVADGSITLAKLGSDVILGSGGAPSGPAGGDLNGSYPNPTINSGAITTTKIADGSVTSAKLAAGVIPSSLPPNGTAGGDLTGSFPNPTINANAVTSTKLANNSVTTAKIVDGSVTSAKLAAGVIPTSLPPSGIAGGDLSGSYPNPAVSKIQNIAVSNTAPVNGQVLKFNGTQWVPAADDVASGSGSNPIGPAGGDLSGNYPDPNIANGAVTSPKIANGSIVTPKLADDAVNSNKLQDNAVTTAKIANGSVTSAKLAAGVIPTSLPPNGAAAGDLTGSYPSPSVSKILGVNVTTTGATNGQVLKFNGTSWVPGTDVTGSGTPSGPAGGDLTGTYPNPTINTDAVTTTKIANGSVTSAKLAAGVIPTSLPPTGTAGGDLTGSYPNPTINTDAITTTKIANGSVTSAKLAAGIIPTSLPPNGSAGGDLSGSYPNPTLNKIQGVNVTATGATTGQVLKFDGTSWVPGTDNSGSGGSNPTGPAGGDLTGSYPNPTINTNAITTTKIADASVTSAKLAAGVIPTSLPPSGTAGGDLTGSYPNPTINNSAITTTKIADASVTSAKLAAGVIPTSLPPSGIASGDLSGSYPSPAVNKIQGITVSNTGLASGMVLKYNGTQWAPATDNTSAFSLPYSQTASSSQSLLSLTNSGTGGGVEGINSSTDINASGVTGKITNVAPGSSAAGVKGVVTGSSVDGYGVYGLHLGSGSGVFGSSAGGAGVYAQSINGDGLLATSDNGNGISANTNNGSYSGVEGVNNSGGVGVLGRTTVFAGGAGVKGWSNVAGGAALEGELVGVTGNIAVFKVDGANKARIDHTGKGFFNGGAVTGGADLAEAFDVEGNRNSYEPGDVLIISQSSDRKVEKSNTAYSTLVAGVYATKPGVFLTEEDVNSDLTGKVPMGVIGVIPTKVCLQGGAIKRGDLLVTSSIAGVAMKADPYKVKVGQVLGKALEDYSSGGIGKIKVLVSVK